MSLRKSFPQPLIISSTCIRHVWVQNCTQQDPEHRISTNTSTGTCLLAHICIATRSLGVSMTACYLTRLNGMHVEYFPWYSIFHNSSLFHRHVFDTYGYRVESSRIQTNQYKDQHGAWSAHARDGRRGTSKKLHPTCKCNFLFAPSPLPRLQREKNEIEQL